MEGERAEIAGYLEEGVEAVQWKLPEICGGDPSEESS